MTTKKSRKPTRKIRSQKSDAIRFLEEVRGGPLTFGAALRAIRESAEVSQTELARRLKITRAHICDIEKGRKNVSPERAAQFAQALDHSEVLFISLALQDQINDAGLSYKVNLKAG